MIISTHSDKQMRIRMQAVRRRHLRATAPDLAADRRSKPRLGLKMPGFSKCAIECISFNHEWLRQGYSSSLATPTVARSENRLSSRVKKAARTIPRRPQSPSLLQSHSRRADLQVARCQRAPDNRLALREARRPASPRIRSRATCTAEPKMRTSRQSRINIC